MMSIDQIHALSAFLGGVAIGLALSAYLQWCDKREAERRAKEPVID